MFYFCFYNFFLRVLEKISLLDMTIENLRRPLPGKGDGRFRPMIGIKYSKIWFRIFVRIQGVAMGAY